MVKSKNIAGIIFIILAVAIYFLGQNLQVNVWLFAVAGAGIGALLAGPLGAIIGGLLGASANIIIGILVLIIAIYTAIIGIFMMALDESRTIWIGLFWAASVAFIALMIIPDPIPFIDELITMGLTVYFAIKTVNPETEVKQLAKF